ncbi:hypothetical protein N7462_003764 [Penicillium macrosclerotiorum]|uniref:uncharacterized protein n=1 Tax=Penicillium macrosclerotiorum TaxID=303699 RepID=UPI002548898A|nr:uncharacterized protein N7462_003764 [Penicillium macrosclerotiorum]KAJ5689372.1 hypothetical protein N7462_003764 [Penicillium macrosclerotiorum]
MWNLSTTIVLPLAFGGLSTASISTGPSITTATGTFKPTSGASCACAKLSRTYTGVIYPQSSNYTAQAADAYWDIRADLSPACIFLPETADGVSNALQIFGSCDAQFAVRGGGHMNYPGSNNINGGVLLALERLKDIKVKASTVEVGPGLTWYDVEDKLEPYGRIVIGGRLKTIGVPGLSLIGGFHYFNNKYGYAMDNVVSYDIVLGNGTHIRATKSSYPDLFWALKGGANNYGVVTKFELETYDIPKISTTIQLYNETSIPAFLTAVCEAAKLDDANPIAAGMVATVSYNATTKAISGSILGVQEGISEPPSQFANFSAVPATTRINNVTTMAQWTSTLDSPKQMFRSVNMAYLNISDRDILIQRAFDRVMFSHKSMKPDPEALYSIYKAWKDSVDKISDVQGLYPTFVTNVHSAGAARVGRTNGIGNVWGLMEEPMILWQFSTGWDLQQDDLRIEAWSRQLAEHLHAINVKKGLAFDFVYMGDAGEWQDPFAGFPVENIDRMRDIRALYDPEGIFSRLNWGGFKLGL